VQETRVNTEEIGGPGRDRTDDLFHTMEVKNCRPLILKGLMTGGTGQNRVNRRNLLPNCYQKTDEWVWGRTVGDRPLH
jgi:hypothetical protein